MIVIATAVFLTYNTVGEPKTYHNGTLSRNGHQAVIVQHPRGMIWGVPERAQADDLGRAACRTLVQELYSRTLGLEELPDHVVVYVGSDGSEGAISLAATLPPERVTFVMCACNWSQKLHLIAGAKMEAARIVRCGCGGHGTMERLLQQFLDCGFDCAHCPKSH